MLVDGRPQSLPASKKTRALLAYLVQVPRPHRRQRLCELLWDGPNDPRAGLRWSLAKLRPALEGDGQERLVADREHVAFEPRGTLIDTLALAPLRKPGAWERDPAQLLEALERFRGPFLEGLDLSSCPAFHAWCVAEREIFRTLHVRLLTTLAETERQEPEKMLGHARALVALDPLDEAPRALVLDALAAMGHARKALDEYDDYERTLARELGGKPSFALEQRRIALARSEVPARAAHVPAPHAAPASADDTARAHSPKQPLLVGRDEPRRILGEVMAQAGGLRIVVITGEPGIGKTRLLDELGRLAREAGGAVLFGRAYEAESVRPYGALAEALRGCEAPSPDGRPAPVSPFSRPAADRTSLYGAVLDLLTATARARAPLVLALDDVQWLDASSAELLHYLARSLRDVSAVMAVAVRWGELADNPAAQRLVRALVRAPSATHLPLAPLAEDDVAALLSPLLDERARRRICVESGGNPLFALEAAHALAQGAEDVVESIEGLLSDRLATLQAADRGLLAWAAALGRSFDVETLAKVAGMPAPELVTALERLERHSILRSRAEGYDFVHDLLRQAAYRQLSEPRRRLLHAQIARVLDAADSPDGPWSGEIAHHAALAGNASLAVRASIAAARRCLRLFAAGQAAELAARAEPLAASLADEEHILALVDLAEIRVLTEPRPDLEAQLSRIAAQAHGLGMTGAEARAFFLRSVLHFRAEDPRAALDSALSRIEAARHASPAELGVELAGAARCCLLLEKNVAAAADFVAQSGRLVGDADVLDLSWSRGMLAYWQGDLDTAIQHLERSLLLARRQHLYWEECECLLAASAIEMDRHDLEAVGLCADALADVGGKLVDGVAYRPMADAWRALADLARQMRPDFSSLESALGGLHDAGASRLLAVAENVAARLALRAGQQGAARRFAEDALRAAGTVERASEIVSASLVLAELELQANDPARARGYLERIPALTSEAEIPERLRPDLRQMLARVASLSDGDAGSADSGQSVHSVSGAS